MMTERDSSKFIAGYQKSFTEKNYVEQNEEHDILMDVFGISPIKKRKYAILGT
jgi:hypothetical protein